jgi:hypothetical protein
MRKIKVYLATFITIVMIATFFSGFALATRVTKANKIIGNVFIDGGKDTKFIMGAEECFFSPSNEQIINRSVQKIQDLDGIVEANRKLAKNGKKGKKKKEGGEKYRKRHDGDDEEDDEIIITEEEEEKNEEEQEKEREQEEKKKQEEEKRQEEERKREEEKIKKEDWFR